jgi:PPK2 family polyphosphate:nucleotide phosphotransferase
MVKLKEFDFLRVKAGEKVRLGEIDTGWTKGVPGREEADEKTEKATQRIGELQYCLYAEARRSLLVVLQGMDAAGKDGAVRKVFDHVNPTGVQVTSFKQPTSEELRHDFLWRVHIKAPPRGYLGIFNRSHYEEVLVVRVHADKLLPADVREEKGVWETRYGMINAFEEMLGAAGTQTVKFFLHISKEEQRKRFMDRQKDKSKHWKLSAGDFQERKYWGDYQEAFEKALSATSTKESPWYVIPADHKWARNYYISHIVLGMLEEMGPKMPKLVDEGLLRVKIK